MPTSTPAPLPATEFQFDREAVFQLYVTFCGDVKRTAASLSMPGIDLQRMVDDEGWADRIKDIIALRKSATPGDVERAMNRAFNYVQAHRMRMIVERAITRLYNLTSDDFDKFVFPEQKVIGTPSKILLEEIEKGGGLGRKLCTRALADLASALEKAQALSYIALTDTAAERVKRKADTTGADSALDLHSKLAAAMEKVRASDSPRALLFDAQLQRAENTPAVATSVPSPHDNDEH